MTKPINAPIITLRTSLFRDMLSIGFMKRTQVDTKIKEPGIEKRKADSPRYYAALALSKTDDGSIPSIDPIT